jgi:hypothetical protein
VTDATTALATQLAPRALVAAGPPAKPDAHDPIASGQGSTEGGHAQRVAHDAHGQRRVTGGSAHRTGSYALASGLHQPRSKQKIIGDLRVPCYCVRLRRVINSV